MTNPHMIAAIEAGAEELHPGLFSLSDSRYSIKYDNNAAYRPTHQAGAIQEVGEMLDAMLPHIRAMIAAEIEVEHLRVKSHNDDGSLDGECAGLHIALTIAKGPQQ